MTMAADQPNQRGFDQADASGGDGSGVRRWWNRQAYTRSENTDAALMVGALSNVGFWAPGLGMVLGILSVLAAVWADRSPRLTGERATRRDAMLAYGSGIAGTVLGMGFVLMVLPTGDIGRARPIPSIRCVIGRKAVR